MNESKERRYPNGKHFQYDFALSSEIRNSRILNDDYQVGELDDLLEVKQKRLQMLKYDLEDIMAEQKLAKQTAFNKGQNYFEDPQRHEKRVTLEAQADVCQLEISTLEEAIEEAEAEKDKHDELPVLLNGPEGINQVRGSKGSGYVDGQWCEFVNGVLVIVETRSTPYRGMKVQDYIQYVAKPWKIACQQNRTKRAKEDFEAGKVPQNTYPVPWPTWPAGVRNHLNGKASLQRKSEPRMIRTK